MSQVARTLRSQRIEGSGSSEVDSGPQLDSAVEGLRAPAYWGLRGLAAQRRDTELVPACHRARSSRAAAPSARHVPSVRSEPVDLDAGSPVNLLLAGIGGRSVWASSQPSLTPLRRVESQLRRVCRAGAPGRGRSPPACVARMPQWTSQQSASGALGGARPGPDHRVHAQRRHGTRRGAWRRSRR